MPGMPTSLVLQPPTFEKKAPAAAVSVVISSYQAKFPFNAHMGCLLFVGMEGKTAAGLTRYVDINIMRLCQPVPRLTFKQLFWCGIIAFACMCKGRRGPWRGGLTRRSKG